VELGGTIRWRPGESISTDSQAVFAYRGESEVNNVPVVTFAFRIDEKTSGWIISLQGRCIHVGMEGLIWIDRGDGSPVRFQLDTTIRARSAPVSSTTTDYGLVSIGDLGKFLLPVRSESVTCAPKTDNCGRNVLEFRNYRKFSAEAHIIDR